MFVLRPQKRKQQHLTQIAANLIRYFSNSHLVHESNSHSLVWLTELCPKMVFPCGLHGFIFAFSLIYSRTCICSFAVSSHTSSMKSRNLSELSFLSFFSTPHVTFCISKPFPPTTPTCPPGNPIHSCAFPCDGHPLVPTPFHTDMFTSNHRAKPCSP